MSLIEAVVGGAVVEWLERLVHVAESRRNVVRSRLGFAKLYQPSSKLVPFSNQGRIRQRKEKDGPRLSFAVSKMQWGSYPPLPHGY